LRIIPKSGKKKNHIKLKNMSRRYQKKRKGYDTVIVKEEKKSDMLQPRMYAPKPVNYRTGGFADIELKFLDTAWNGVAINSSTDGADGEIQPSTGCTNCLSVPAQGDGESNRDGRKWILHGAFASGCIAYQVQNDQDDAVQFPSVFLALVLDTQANGATINSEDVFINPSTSAQAMVPQPLRNLEHSKRFRILDHCFIEPSVYAFNDAAATGTIDTMNNPTFKLSWRSKKGIMCHGTGADADIANVSDNAMHLLAYKGTTGGTLTIFGKCRVRFTG
jgi:hypothetical protein